MFKNTENKEYHTHAAIISIGDELTRGQNLDTNSKWLSSALMDVGIETVEHVTIPDDARVHAATLTRLATAAPLIISTGGLGPTADDLTRDALAAAMHDRLIVDEPSLRDLEAKFAKRGRTLTDLQRLQTLRPSNAANIPNPLGTAPGLHGRVLDAEVFCLPGPPAEMHAMFYAHVAPRLHSPPDQIVRTRLLHMIGIGEGDAAKAAGELLDRSRNPLIGITASDAVVSWRVRSRATTMHEADAALDADERELRARFQPYIFGVGNQTLAGVVIDELRARRETLGVVESCTGGTLAALLTDVPGASDVFRAGLVTYATEAKSQLAHVPQALVAEYTPVSSECAAAMAAGGLRTLSVHHSIAITGIAGPAGGTTQHPVGTVFIAVASSSSPAATERIETRRFLIPGSRADVRQRASRLALGMLLNTLKITPPDKNQILQTQPGNPNMLFEVPDP